MKIYTPAPAFRTFSITGDKCALNCKHCGRHYLLGMKRLERGQLPAMSDDLKAAGLKGVLISGGCDVNGSVPLSPYVDDISKFRKSTDILVNVHTGLITDPELPICLKEAHVDRVSFDYVGDINVARSVYGIDPPAAAYYDSLQSLMNAGLSVSPHITIGLDFGRIGHEIPALKDIIRLAQTSDGELNSVVFLILIPTPGTPMQDVTPPDPHAIETIFRYAKEHLNNIPWKLGCMRPRKDENYAHTVEMLALKYGASGMVGLTRRTREYMKQSGITLDNTGGCCVF